MNTTLPIIYTATIEKGKYAGTVIKSHLTDAEAAEIVREKYEGNDFAADLVYIFTFKRSKFSPARRVWLHKLALDAIKPKAEAKTINAEKIKKLFDTALASGMKRPRIKTIVNKVMFAFNLAGSNSKWAGSIYVKVDGAYAGRITEGLYYPTLDTFNNKKYAIEAFKVIAAAPKSILAIAGKETGNCCYCWRELTDPRSLAVGYGPICAGKYGLPWGDKKINDDVDKKIADALADKVAFMEKVLAKAKLDKAIEDDPDYAGWE